MSHFSLSLINRPNKTKPAIFISLFWFGYSRGIDFLSEFLIINYGMQCHFQPACFKEKVKLFRSLGHHHHHRAKAHYSKSIKGINTKLVILAHHEKVQLQDKGHNSESYSFKVMPLFNILSRMMAPDRQSLACCVLVINVFVNSVMHYSGLSLKVTYLSFFYIFQKDIILIINIYFCIIMKKICMLL